MTIKYNKDLVGAILFLYVAIILWVLIPSQIVVKSTEGINSQTFPRLIVGIIGIVSLYLLLQEIIKIVLKKERNIGALIMKDELKHLSMIGLVVLFWLLLKFLPFIVAAIIFGSLTLLLYKCKKWSYFLIVNCLIIAVAFIFETLLRVNLP